ncbi:unnamed protein product [Larinioides sclopetarius]|uniref:Protein sleepless n=2 Tax=Larinioides sclopetarius TaxID=280406 RepID=A0AAV1Z7Z5_9ARAC
MINNVCIVVGVIVLFGLFSPGLCIECFRCNSTNNLDCLEKFMHPNPLRAESCADVFEARYCIKTTGIYNGFIGTRRFCSSRDLGNFCEFIYHEGEKREYKGCVYTCESDGCNAAFTNYPAPLPLGLITFTALVALVSKRILNST